MRKERLYPAHTEAAVGWQARQASAGGLHHMVGASCPCHSAAAVADGSAAARPVEMLEGHYFLLLVSWVSFRR